MTHPGRPRRFPKEQIPHLKKLYRHLNPLQIAMVTGASHTTVRNTLIRAGVKLRSPKEERERKSHSALVDG
jgi:hypothetical protein